MKTCRWNIVKTLKMHFLSNKPPSTLYIVSIYITWFFLYAETLCRHCHFTFIISFINYCYIIIFWGLFFDDRSVTLTNRSWIRQSHGIERSQCCWFINTSSRMLMHAYTCTNSYKDRLWCLFFMKFHTLPTGNCC